MHRIEVKSAYKNKNKKKKKKKKKKRKEKKNQLMLVFVKHYTSNCLTLTLLDSNTACP